ncbi:hypothetical protein JCM8097_007899 [Rhodosporidiobolus ruineniae]
MSALEWANEVLSLASGSQTPPRLHDLSAAPEELVSSWVSVLKEADFEEKETVLRALRCCRFVEGHDLILPAILPLVLHSSSSLALQAAGCLIQYSSSAPSDDLRPLLSSIVTIVIRALSPLQFQLPSASSSTLPRLASTLLRLLNALVLKLAPLSAETVASVGTLLSTWIHHGLSASAGRASPAPSLFDRGRTPAQGQLAFGVMSAFAPSGNIRPRKTRARKDSEVSVASSRATSVGRGVESGSEDEGGQPRDRRRDSAQLRLDALTCLRNLAASDPKALHKHWSLFLSDSPYLRTRPTLFNLVENDPSRSVRIQACAALSVMLEGSASYLAIAEDRPTKASFTSLSSSLGETVSEFHLSLSALLAAPLVAGQTELRLALLDLAAKLAANAPYGRLKKPLAWSLAKAILPSLASPDSLIASTSASTLAVIATRYTSTSSTQTFEWDQLAQAVTRLLEAGREEDVQRAGWLLATALAAELPGHDWSNLLILLDAGFSTTSCTLQEAQSAFLVSLLRINPSKDALTPLLPRPSHLLYRAFSSPHPSVRLRACEALSLPALSPPPAPDRESLPPEETVQPWTTALSLASDDPSTAVRDAACRALGLLAKAAEGVEDGSRSVVDAVEVLRKRLNEEEEKDTAGLCWALANCCDALQPPDRNNLDLDSVLCAAVSLLGKGDSDERTRTSCFRIIGAVFKLVPASCGSAEDVVRSLLTGLADPSAKVRWNACIASSSALPALVAHSSPSSAALVSALTALLLQDPSFKARSQAIGALSAYSQVAGERVGGSVVDALDGFLTRFDSTAPSSAYPPVQPRRDLW